LTDQDASVWVSRQNPNPEFSTHLGLSNGAEVRYAGTVQFNNNTTRYRGLIQNWSNDTDQIPFSRDGRASQQIILPKVRQMKWTRSKGIFTLRSGACGTKRLHHGRFIRRCNNTCHTVRFGLHVCSCLAWRSNFSQNDEPSV
jgi:hypothetical protein